MTIRNLYDAGAPHAPASAAAWAQAISDEVDTALQPADVGTAAAADVGDFDAAGEAASAQAFAVQRANHTGTQAIATVDGLQGALDGKLDALPATAGLTIVETSTGVWSGDAPARAAGVNPVVFVGLNDPADPTDGIDTPANINVRDRWVQVDSL